MGFQKLNSFLSRYELCKTKQHNAFILLANLHAFPCTTNISKSTSLYIYFIFKLKLLPRLLASHFMMIIINPKILWPEKRPKSADCLCLT